MAAEDGRSSWKLTHQSILQCLPSLYAVHGIPVDGNSVLCVYYYYSVKFDRNAANCLVKTYKVTVVRYF